MPPHGSSQTLLSPAELSFLHSSLSSTPPIRPDLRTPTQFRPLVAETDILPSTNGSARICFNDGTEAIVGIKAEVEKTTQQPAGQSLQDDTPDTGIADNDNSNTQTTPTSTRITSTHLELSIEIPSHRDDDPLPTFLASMLTETLLSTPHLSQQLHINARWHWKLYIDVLLLSPPLSYPLPLLSLTTHLALLNTRLPRLKSEREDDPLFDDDWGAAVPLYPQQSSSLPTSSTRTQHGIPYTANLGQRPPITLLTMTISDNIIFDPSREELAVADAVLAITVASTGDAVAPLRLVAIRTVDPPSRLTPLGVADAVNPATAAGAAAAGAGGGGGVGGGVGGQGQGQGQAQKQNAMEAGQETGKETVWSPPRGGIKRGLVARIVKAVIEKGGVGEEVLEGLAGVETGK